MQIQVVLILLIIINQIHECPQYLVVIVHLKLVHYADHHSLPGLDRLSRRLPHHLADYLVLRI